MGVYSSLESRGILDDADNPGQWGPGTPLSEWYGVTILTEWFGEDCTMHEGPVVDLDLTQAGIAGPISPALGDLQDLEHLRLDLNDLTGPIEPLQPTLTVQPCSPLVPSYGSGLRDVSTASI